MSAAITLTQMADLALGTPEVGAVNFNVLHTLLHTMIQKLGISDVKTEIPKSDKEFLTRRRDEPDALSNAGTDISDKDSAITGMTDYSSSARSDKSKRTPYHHLEDKVAKLEKQFSELNELPSNQNLYDRAKKGEGERPTPVSDMWQTMQLKNRVDSNEEGIGKLMSLVQDLMSDMQSMKDDMKSLKDENKDIRKQLEDVKNMDELLKRLKDLENFTQEMNDKFSQLPGPEMFNDYVSWAALEDALRGLRDGLNELNNRPPPEIPEPPQRVVIEMSSQTTPRSSRPNSSRPASGRGPSEDLKQLLEKLGRLTDRHDKLEVRVDNIEDELKNKLDKSALEGLNLGVPEDLLEKLKALQDEIDRLKKTVGRLDQPQEEEPTKKLETPPPSQAPPPQARPAAVGLTPVSAPPVDPAPVRLLTPPPNNKHDNEAFARMQQTLANLQSELQRIDKTTQKLMDQNDKQQISIEELYKLCSQLEENKADKEFVQTEVEVKADKQLVDGKVNRSLFDSTCEDLNKMINDILNKLSSSDDDWKKLLAQINEDLDGKLDRLEFGPIKDELEKQLRALAKRLKDMNRDYDHFEDDAAGIRKQLIQRFHCISCDRPVDMMPQGPVPSIPNPNALPATRSSRPYTTFELEQIRQHAKKLYQGKYDPYVTVSQPTADPMDAYQTSRSCGGSHTLTYPHRRTARSAHINDGQPHVTVEQQKMIENFWARKSNIYRDDTTEVTVIPTQKGEVDIQGADGHIYRGRGRGFPNLATGGNASKNHPMLPKRAQTSMENANAAPQMSPRPTSARMSRPTSARPMTSPRPQSQADVTLPRENGSGGGRSPPPAPAPSEPDTNAQDI